MRRESLLRHLRRFGCVLRREEKEHSISENPRTGPADLLKADHSKSYKLRTN